MNRTKFTHCIALFFSLLFFNVNADCNFTSGGRVLTFAAPPSQLTVSPDLAVGTVVWSSSVYSPIPANLTCNSSGYWQGGLVYQEPPSLPDVYPLPLVPGLGVRTTASNNNDAKIYSIPFQTDSSDPVRAQSYSVGILWGIELVVTNKLTPGQYSFPGSGWANIFYENLNIHELNITAFDFNVSGGGCSVVTSSLNVPLKNHSITEFTGVNSTTNSVDVPVQLNCPNSGTKILATLNATKDMSTSQSGAIKINSGGTLTATGVAVQMVDGNNNGIPLNSQIQYIVASPGLFNFGWKARYLQTTSASVTAGDANASASVTIEYE